MKKWMLCLAGVLSGAMAGCNNDATSPTAGEATLRMWLTDKTAAYDAVNITFTEISAHIDSQWIVLNDQTQTVNLLDWNNGKTLLLGQADIEAGTYTQIRLKIAAAEVVWNGQSYPMDVPSGAQSGLKLLTKFEIAAGSTYDIVLDFDAERSVVTTGPPQNPKGFKLKPTIRAMAMAFTGPISGRVANPAALPVAVAVAGNDTITASAVDPVSGDFRLAFLPPMAYVVSITDTLGRAFSKPDAPVNAGQDYALGSITLQ